MQSTFNNHYDLRVQVNGNQIVGAIVEPRSIQFTNDKEASCYDSEMPLTLDTTKEN